MWHFLLQLLQSKESFVHRALCLKQILSCVEAKFLGIGQIEHLGRKIPQRKIPLARPVRGSLVQPSFICYEIKRDSSWGKPWAGADSWKTDPLKGKWDSKSEWGWRKVAKELHTRNGQKGKKNAKTDRLSQRRKVPVEKIQKGQRPVSLISNISKEGNLGTFQTRTNQLLY